MFRLALLHPIAHHAHVLSAPATTPAAQTSSASMILIFALVLDDERDHGAVVSLSGRYGEVRSRVVAHVPRLCPAGLVSVDVNCLAWSVVAS
jgi:hypothetical protein